MSVSFSSGLVKRGLQIVGLLAAGVLFAVVVGMYAENRDNRLMPSGRWLGWTGYTVMLSVLVIRDRRQHWRYLSFWLALAALFAVHTALYAIVFQAVHIWRPIWFLPISIAEYPILLFALESLGYRDDGHNTNSRVFGTKPRLR